MVSASSSRTNSLPTNYDLGDKLRQVEQQWRKSLTERNVDLDYEMHQGCSYHRGNDGGGRQQQQQQIMFNNDLVAASGNAGNQLLAAGAPPQNNMLAAACQRQTFDTATLTVAFAPDNSHFAWACGPKSVAVIPWREAGGQDGAMSTKMETDQENIRQPFVVYCEELVSCLTFGVSSSEFECSASFTNVSSTSSGCTTSSSANVDGSGNDGLLTYLSKRRASRQNRVKDFYNFRSAQNRLVLAVGLKNGRIRLYSVYGAKFIIELIDHKKAVRQLQFRPDFSMVLMSASMDCTLKLWDLYDDCNMFQTLTHHADQWVSCCCWSPNGRYAASGGVQSTLFVYDTSDFSTVYRTLRGHLNTVTCCQFSPDGALLCSASYDTTAIVWDFVKNERLCTFRHLLPPPRLIYASGSNDYYVRSCAFSPDGKHVTTVCDDGLLRTWSIFEGQNSNGLEDGSSTATNITVGPVAAAQMKNALSTVYSADGAFLAVGTRQGQVQLFAAYMKVQSLMQICRRFVRKLLINENGGGRCELPLPIQLKSYLQYENLHKKF